MTRPRDTQRQKLYDAEQAAFGSYELLPLVGDGSVAAAQAYVDQVLARAYVQRKYPAAKRAIVVTDGRSRRRAGYTSHHLGGTPFGVATIAAPRFTRSTTYLLHEVAHHLHATHPDDEAAHNWRFASIFLDIVRHMLGKEAHDQLRDAFKKHRVKYRQPQQLSDEERSRRAARLLQSVA